MANPWTGEVALAIDGERHVLKLTLGALAELEAGLQAGTLVELIERFETGAFSTRDVLALIVAVGRAARLSGMGRVEVPGTRGFHAEDRRSD